MDRKGDNTNLFKAWLLLTFTLSLLLGNWPEIFTLIMMDRVEVQNCVNQPEVKDLPEEHSPLLLTKTKLSRPSWFGRMWRRFFLDFSTFKTSDDRPRPYPVNIECRNFNPHGNQFFNPFGFLPTVGARILGGGCVPKD